MMPRIARWSSIACFVLVIGCGSPPRRHVSPSHPAGAYAEPATDQDGQPRRLSDYRGKWVVLYFYPKDDTPGCIRQATEFSAMAERFAAINAVVVGISEDSAISHRHFADKHGVGIVLLADPDHRLAQSFGAWREVVHDGRTAGRTIRTTVLLDPAGRPVWRQSPVIPEGHAQEVHTRLRAVQSKS